MKDKLNPVYLGDNLFDIWPYGKETRDTQKSRIDLCRQIARYYRSCSKLLSTYYNSLEKGEQNKLYIGYVIHDGNRCCSLVESLIDMFDDGDYSHPWNPLLDLYHFVWQAEFIIQNLVIPHIDSSQKACNNDGG